MRTWSALARSVLGVVAAGSVALPVSGRAAGSGSGAESIRSCGRIANPTTARSRLLGGMVWGIGAAVRPATGVRVRDLPVRLDELVRTGADLRPVGSDGIIDR